MSSAGTAPAQTLPAQRLDVASPAKKMPGACGTIGLALTVLYVAYMAAMAHEMAYPRACKGHGCYQALLTDQRVDLRLVVRGAEVWQALNVSADEQLDFKVELPVPPEVRRGTVDHLIVELYLAVHGATHALAVARANAVKRMLPRVHEASMLLDGAGASNEPPVKDVGPAAPDHEGKVPHYVYARSRLDVRLVRDWTPHRSVYHVDGVPVGSSFDHQARRYAPHWYADSFPLLSKHALPLSSDEGRAHPTLHVRVTPIRLGLGLGLGLSLTVPVTVTLILTNDQLGMAPTGRAG